MWNGHSLWLSYYGWENGASLRYLGNACCSLQPPSFRHRHSPFGADHQMIQYADLDGG